LLRIDATTGAADAADAADADAADEMVETPVA
jgi:hypothetical protein